MQIFQPSDLNNDRNGQKEAKIANIEATLLYIFFIDLEDARQLGPTPKCQQFIYHATHS